MKGYKIFNKNWTDDETQHIPGETSRCGVKPEMYKTGFWFCPRALNCLNFYELDEEQKYAEVEAVGKIVKKRGIYYTNALRIVREISYEDFKSKCTGLLKSYWRNGNRGDRITYENGVEHGPYRTHWKYNGDVHIKATKVNGVFHGSYVENHSSGQPYIECNYNNGELDGPYVEYLEYSNTVVKEANYKMGKLDGLYEEYYNSNVLKLSVNYKDGKRDGHYVKYYDCDCCKWSCQQQYIKEERSYEMDRVIESACFAKGEKRNGDGDEDSENDDAYEE